MTALEFLACAGVVSGTLIVWHVLIAAERQDRAQLAARREAMEREPLVKEPARGWGSSQRVRKQRRVA